LLVNDNWDPRQPRCGSTEQMGVVGLSVKHIDPLPAEPSRKPPNLQGIEALGGEKRQKFHRHPLGARLLAEKIKAAQTDKTGFHFGRKVRKYSERKILGTANRHPDK
jgi:hypothetical protein